MKDIFCEQYSIMADEQYPCERVSAKIKSIRGNFKNAVDSGKKSRGGRIVFKSYDICERIMGVVLIQNIFSLSIVIKNE